MARTIPPSLVPLVEHLEREQPTVITTSAISAIAARMGIKTPGKLIAYRLANRGWLIPTDVHGVWEFTPADGGVPASDEDQLMSVRATLAVQPEAGIAMAHASALWLLGISNTPPDTHQVAIPVRGAVPLGIQRNYRVLRFTVALKPKQIEGLPVHQPASVLVHVASNPTNVRGWKEILERLGDLVAATNERQIREELSGRPTSTHVRLAYLLSGVAPKLVKRLKIRSNGNVWFGPRTEVQRYDRTWNIVDTVLPMNPAELRAVD